MAAPEVWLQELSCVSKEGPAPSAGSFQDRDFSGRKLTPVRLIPARGLSQAPVPSITAVTTTGSLSQTAPLTVPTVTISFSAFFNLWKKLKTFASVKNRVN